MTALAWTVAAHLGVPALWRRRHRDHVLILGYHAVAPGRGASRWTAVTAGALRLQLSWLRRRYRVLPLSEVVAHWASGAPLPPCTAAITFDDGYRDAYTLAFPLLQELAVPATVFVATGFVDGTARLWADWVRQLFESTAAPRLAWDGRTVPLGTPVQRRLGAAAVVWALKSMPAGRKAAAIADLELQLGRPSAADAVPVTWEQLRAMHASGLFEVGSHSVSHEILSQLDAAAQEAEVSRSCARIAAQLGTPCRLFAYPNGRPADFDERTVAILRAHGVAAAVTTVEGLASGADDRYRLPRVLVGGDATPAKFRLQASGFLAPFVRRSRRAPA